MDSLEHWIKNSCRRLYGLMESNAPRQLIDKELRLLVRRTSALVGPDQVRRWIDQISDELIDRATKPEDNPKPGKLF